MFSFLCVSLCCLVLFRRCSVVLLCAEEAVVCRQTFHHGNSRLIIRMMRNQCDYGGGLNAVMRRFLLLTDAAEWRLGH